MAAFENRTIEEIKTLLLEEFQQHFNQRLRILPKSFIRVLSTVCAGVFIILYKQIGWLFLQLFPDTAYYGEVTVLGRKIRPLVQWGELLGIGLPRAGVQWQGIITVEVTVLNTSLPAGTQLKSDITGKIYLTDVSTFLETVTTNIAVTCNEAGTAGSLDIGDIISFVQPLGNVKNAAVVGAVTREGTDNEAEGDYRYRVANRYRMQPRGGSLADYRLWATSISGVLNVYPYYDTELPGGVALYVSANPDVYPDRIAAPELLVRVGEACTYNPETGKSDRKPITAILDPNFDGTYKEIRAMIIKNFDIHITGLAGASPADFASAAKASIQNYFWGREPYIRGLSDDNNRTDAVLKNNILSVVDQIASSIKVQFATVIMTLDGVEIPSYMLGRGELANMEHFYIDGEEF